VAGSKFQAVNRGIFHDRRKEVSPISPSFLARFVGNQGKTQTAAQRDFHQTAVQRVVAYDVKQSMLNSPGLNTPGESPA